jgi:hypothetical protein
MNLTVTCPKCQNTFDPSDEIKNHLEKVIRDEYVSKYKTELSKKEADLREQIKKEVDFKFNDLEKQSREKDEKIKKFEDKELELRQRERKLTDEKRELEEKINKETQKWVKENKAKFIGMGKSMAKNESDSLLTSKDKMINDLIDSNKSLLLSKSQLEDAQKAWELQKNTEINSIKDDIWKKAYSHAAEETRLKDAQKDKQLEDLKRQIEDLKKKSDLGSQQLQGEAFEIDVEMKLRNYFRYDDIEPVPTGTRGADILQIIHNRQGQKCGSILWEIKETKNWNNSWIPKLKDDQRTSNANIAIILSSVLPKEISHIGIVEGIWICNYNSFIGLAAALRHGIIEISRVQNSMIGIDGKVKELYDYFSGSEFRLKMEAIIETFTTMKEELDSEKRAITSIWAKREKQINRIMTSTSSLYGDMKEIIGKTLLPIEQLELLSLEEPDNSMFSSELSKENGENEYYDLNNAEDKS